MSKSRRIPGFRRGDGMRSPAPNAGKPSSIARSGKTLNGREKAVMVQAESCARYK
jgi:hypothetical protein